MKIKFRKDSKEFHHALSEAVEEYYLTTGKSKKANSFWYFKTFFFMFTLAGSYTAILWGGFNIALSYCFWVILGLSSVFLAVNCGHDAIHGASSEKRWINKLMSKTFDLLGANSYIWSISHNIVHHSFTSINSVDEDIESVPFARLSPYQNWKPYMRYQHIYTFMLYSLATISWVFMKDYRKFFQKQIGNYENKHHSGIEYFNLFFFKLIYYILFLAIPLVIVDMPWFVTLGGFVISHLFEGLTIAVIFALAHLVEKAQFSEPDEQGNMNINWAIHQLYTTADFGRNSAATSFFTGGLNFQIEHHLFPSICHVHYPAISKIVKKLALDYSVPYNEYDNVKDALVSHVNWLKIMGNNKSHKNPNFLPVEERFSSFKVS